MHANVKYKFLEDLIFTLSNKNKLHISRDNKINTRGTKWPAIEYNY